LIPLTPQADGESTLDENQQLRRKRTEYETATL